MHCFRLGRGTRALTRPSLRAQILEARHCAFVTFGERGSAERAAEELQNKLLVRGQRAKLCWGRPQERRPDAPPAGAPPPSMMPPQARRGFSTKPRVSPNLNLETPWNDGTGRAAECATSFVKGTVAL